MRSARFNCAIVFTEHAKKRMVEREMDESLILQLVETGEARYQDARRFWLARHFAERSDNLICAALVNDSGVLVIKTLMHHFTWSTPK